MSTVTIAAPLVQTLMNINQPVELCDELGRVIGRFTPTTGKSVPPPLSEEELQRREQEPDLTTADVLAMLEKL